MFIVWLVLVEFEGVVDIVCLLVVGECCVDIILDIVCDGLCGILG